MMKGRIAIPGKDPKSWRSRGRKRKPAQDIPAIIEGVRSPQEIAKAKRIAKLPWGVGR